MSTKEQLHPSELIEQELNLLQGNATRISAKIGKDCDAAILGGDLEDSVALSLHIHARLAEVNERWVNAVQDGSQEFSIDDARIFERHFQQWHAVSSAVVDIAEKRGAPLSEIKDLADLRKRIAFCPYVGLTVDKMMRAAKQIEAGNTVPFNKVKDGLRDRMVARGQ